MHFAAVGFWLFTHHSTKQVEENPQQAGIIYALSYSPTDLEIS